MLEDISFSVTKSYLESLGVDTNNFSQVQDMIYLLGGNKYDIDINFGALVRCPDMPSICRIDDLYVTTRRKNAYVGTLCGEGENLDVKNQYNKESARLCNTLDYTDNYLENARQRASIKTYKQRKHKSKAVSHQATARA